MHVARVRVLGLRNLSTGETGLDPGPTLLWGANGAGKTSFLEALCLGLTGRSPQTRSEREAIGFGAELARVEVIVADGAEERTFLWSLTRAGDRRHLVDGSAAGAEHARLRPALAIFLPDRLALVKGPPGARRAHLDRFCGALWPARAEAPRRYARALAQRNALLQRIRAGLASDAALDAWDHELATAAAELMVARLAAAERLTRAFAEAAAELGLGAGAELTYRPRCDSKTVEGIAGELRELRALDQRRGFSGHGPHRDELLLSLDGRELRRFGSQGEQRGALLALLFAERRALVGAGRPLPLMLLDDVMSELDPDRRSLLCARLARGGGQAILTATEAGAVPPAFACRRRAVRGGAVLAGVEGGMRRAAA